jgi:UDP-N-acetyl-D-glucosamine dehydrogenase
MPEHVVALVSEGLNRQRKAVNGSTVLLLGLAYKRNTSDARESPSLRVAKLLAGMGAHVHAADPHVVEDLPFDVPVVRVEASAAEVAEADAVILLTDHDEYDLATVASTGRYVLDCRRRLPDGPNVERL